MPDANVAKTLIRVFDLLRLLPKYGSGKTAGEMHDELTRQGYEIEKRTVERDLRMLESAFPEYIRCNDQTKPFGWRWQPGRELCVTNISPAEAVILQSIEQTLEGMLPGGLLETLQPRFEQARLTLPEAESPASSRGREVLHFVSTRAPTLTPEVSAETIAEVVSCLLRGEPFEADFRRDDATVPQHLLLHPHRLVQRGAVTSVLAFSANDQSPALYGLHRLLNVKRKPQPREPLPASFEVDSFLAALVPTYPFLSADNQSISILAEIDDRLQKELLDTPLAENQQFFRQDGKWMLRATLIPGGQLKAWILQNGKSIRIDEPPELRAQIAAELEQALAAYDGRA